MESITKMKRLLFSISLLLFSIVGLGQGSWDYVGTATGTDTYSVTILAPTFPSSFNSTTLRLHFNNANTGASTVTVVKSSGSVGPAAIRKWDGDSWEPLVAGDIPANSEGILQYDLNVSYFKAVIFENIGSGSTYTAGNGLTLSGTAFKLGGTLTENTTFSGSGFNSTWGSSGTRIGNFRVWSNGTIGLDASTSAFLQTGSNTVTTSSSGIAIASTGPLSINTDDGTSGQVLTSNGTGAAPTWEDASGGVSDGDKGDITVLGGTWTIDNLAVTDAKINDVAIGKITGLGSNVATWLTTPSYTNFLAAVTGTSPYWLLSSGGTLTGVNTITSNARNQLAFGGTWTSSANNDYHTIFNPSITFDANTRTVNAVTIQPSFTTGGFLNTVGNALFVDGKTLIKTKATSGQDEAFKITDSGNATILNISSDGRIRLFNNGSPSYLAGGSGTSETKNGGGLFLNANPTSGGLILQGAFSAASGNSRMFQFINSYSGTGTADHTEIAFTGTYNSSASGAIKFMDYNPTETAIGSGGHYWLTQRSTTALSVFGAATGTSTLETARSFGAGMTSVSTNTTLDASHYAVEVDASGGAITITLPAASTAARRIYKIIKIDSSGNSVTIDGNSSETISGATTVVITTQWGGKEIQRNTAATGWTITGSF
jgi:hypothetical protein